MSEVQGIMSDRWWVKGLRERERKVGEGGRGRASRLVRLCASERNEVSTVLRLRM